MPGIQVERNSGVMPIFILVFIVISATMMHADSGNHFYINAQIGLRTVAVDLSCLGEQGGAQGGGE
jgi:hypothetical protein